MILAPILLSSRLLQVTDPNSPSLSGHASSEVVIATMTRLKAQLIRNLEAVLVTCLWSGSTCGSQPIGLIQTPIYAVRVQGPAPFAQCMGPDLDA